jgi:hypothetical protein
MQDIEDRVIAGSDSWENKFNLWFTYYLTIFFLACEKPVQLPPLQLAY